MNDYDFEKYERDDIYERAEQLRIFTGYRYTIDYIYNFIIEWESMQRLFENVIWLKR